MNANNAPAKLQCVLRAWEEYFETYPEPTVAGIWQRWNRHRKLFDRTDGLGMTNRDVELALRAKTDVARDRLNEAEDTWEASGYRYRGRHFRRWSKRRMDFFKALYTENEEYEGTLRFRGIDPLDERMIQDFLRNLEDEPTEDELPT